MELIPGTLAWNPEKAITQGGAPGMVFEKTLRHEDWLHVSAFRFCGELGSRYHVYHYTAKCLGRAFGPLDLAQTIVFCRNLREALIKPDAKGHELFTEPGKEEAHSNASVLVGAYLILCCGWTTQRCTDKMGAEEAQRMFACSWSRADVSETTRFMSVADCWAGVELAKERGWVVDELIIDDDQHKKWVNNFRRMLTVYDASWLVPGALLLSADPTTTVYDPNPATCNEVFPGEKTIPETTAMPETPSKPLSSAASGGSSGSAAKAPAATDAPIAPDTAGIRRKSPEDGSGDGSSTAPGPTDGSVEEASVTLPGQQNTEDDEGPAPNDNDSTDTVCKPNAVSDSPPSSAGVVCSTSIADAGTNLQLQNRPKPFVTFLQDCMIAMVVRCNYSNEPGMAGSYYDSRKLKSFDIEHKDIRIPDYGGGMPGKEYIEDVLKVTEGYMGAEGRGVLVHCKGGFGRSIVLACCVLINRLDVPGSALMGWARLCRAGAITTSKQELFLRSMCGRSDLKRYVRSDHTGLAKTSADTWDANFRCRCSVQ